jgi:hypothetical protein
MNRHIRNSCNIFWITVNNYTCEFKSSISMAKAAYKKKKKKKKKILVTRKFDLNVSKK